MRFNLSTMSRALQFRYTDDERLYTDHDGRRVIVDVEGPGEMRLMHAEPDVLTVREGEPPQMFCPKFEDGSIVLAEGPGPTHIQVAFPFIPNLSSAKSEEVALPIRGCGWLIGASNRVVVDDLHEWSPDPSPQFPVNTPDRTTAAAFLRYAQGDVVADSATLQWPGLYVRRFRFPRVVDRFLVPATAEPLISCVVRGMAEFQEREIGGTWLTRRLQRGDIFVTRSTAWFCQA